MAMQKTRHPLCERGFLKSSNTGNYTRFGDDIQANYWVGKAPGGWQARRYPKGSMGGATYWEGPTVADPWAAFCTGELAGWGE